ncbi:MAG TPA: nucleoside hydrolase [Nocardioidaceae bacterium]|nr:nucleoside hydrolase [Nocardioidaceae bacterium]
MRLHLDTDFGDNPDDACALAMVLGWPGAELVGITTTADPHGARAARVTRFLSRLGAGDIPVASGADEGAAEDLLSHSVGAGATVAAIGPFTNLARLEGARSGTLSGVRVVTMGGWVDPFGDGYPGWGPDRDHNVQADTAAALALFESDADLTLVPCASAVAACLRTTDLVRLSSSGPAGALLAEESTRHGRDKGYPGLGRRHVALPDDLVSFHWDPLTCAVALGWSGATVSESTLRPVLERGVLRFERHPGARRTRVVGQVDGVAFADLWLTAVERAQGRMR